MTPIRTQQHAYRLPLRNGYIVDARIAWWKVQTRRQAIVLTVAGELDALNTERLDRSVHHVRSVGDPFVIDISAVNFLGAQYVRMFLGLEKDVEPTAQPGHWSLTRRRIGCCASGDRDGVLPVAGSLFEALHDVAAVRRGLLRLVPGAVRGR